MRVSIFIIGLLLASCGGSGSFSSDNYYNGEIIFSKGADISNMEFIPLSSPSLADVMADADVIDTKEEFDKLIAWQQAAKKEIRASPESESLGKQLTVSCQAMEMVDLELAKSYLLYDHSERDAYLEANVKSENVAYAKKTNARIVSAMLYYFANDYYSLKDGSRGVSKDSDRSHEFLKKNCPKYAAFMEIAESNLLNFIDGKVSSDEDIDRVNAFIGTINWAFKLLSDKEEKTKIYADAVCQVLARNPQITVNSVQVIESEEGDLAMRVKDIEDDLLDKKLESLGIAKTFSEKREFKKNLVKSCSNYGEWVDYKREQMYDIYRLIVDKEGDYISGNPSFKAPSVPYNSFAEIKSHVDSLRAKWDNKSYYGVTKKDIPLDKYAEWTAKQSCDCFRELDMDFIRQKNFPIWVAAADINYRLGVERPEDMKLLLLSELFAIYGKMSERGQIVDIPSLSSRQLRTHSLYSERAHKKAVQKQCGKLRDELYDLHKKILSVAITKEFYSE